MLKRIVVLLLFVQVSFGQDYGNDIDTMKLCTSLQANNFGTDAEAERGLDKILSVIGASKNFVLQPCNNINNAVATAYKGKRYILYDRQFMNSISNGNNWGNLFILAHEVGHHINGHSLDLVLYAAEVVEPESLVTKRKQELEADEFAGFVLAKLGGPISAANQTIIKISSNSDDSYSTHPSRDKRLAAVKKGFNKVSKSGNIANQNNIDAVYYNIGRWEGPATIKEEFVAVDGVIKKRISKRPYGKGVFIFNDGTTYKGFWYDELLKRKTTSSNQGSSTNLKNANKIKAVDYLNSANEKYDNGDYYGAIAGYTKAIELKPDYADAYYNIGIAKRDLKDYYGAIANYTKAIELSPGFSDAYSERGIAKSNLKDYNGAIADYTKTIELDPDYTRAFYNRANAKQNLKDYYGAIADYTKAIELDPDRSIAYNNRGITKDKLKDYNGAIADYTKSIELKPDNDYIYYKRGEASAKIKDYTSAIDDYTKAIELDPDYPQYYSNRAWYKILKNDFYSAIDDCNKAIQLDPNYGPAYNNRGNAKNKLDDLKGACSDWTIASKMGNNYAQESLKKLCN